MFTVKGFTRRVRSCAETGFGSPSSGGMYTTRYVRRWYAAWASVLSPGAT